MYRVQYAMVCFAAIASTTISAQSQGQNSGGGPVQPEKGRPVTVTGCLQEWQPQTTAVGTAGASSSSAPVKSASNRRWVLTTSDPNANTTAETYVLEGRTEEFDQHSNRRVEVAGTMVGSTPSTGPVSDAPGSGSDAVGSTVSAGTGTTPTVPSGPHVRVTSIRQVADDCRQR